MELPYRLIFVITSYSIHYTKLYDPPNIRHWHGTSPNSGLQQMYIVPNTEKGVVNWMEAVTDEQYNNLKI